MSAGTDGAGERPAMQPRASVRPDALIRTISESGTIAVKAIKDNNGIGTTPAT